MCHIYLPAVRMSERFCPQKKHVDRPWNVVRQSIKSATADGTNWAGVGIEG